MEQDKDTPEAIDESQFNEDVVAESEAENEFADLDVEVSPEQLHLLLEDARATFL